MADSRFRLGRHYDFYELLADGVVHGIGVALALVGVAFLIPHVSAQAGPTEVLATAIYAAGLILSLAASFTYNMMPKSPLKWYLRRLDHSAIFILIAATYTPFLHKASSDPTALALLVCIWVTAALGVALKCLLPGRYDRLAIFLYLLMGWSGLIAFRPIADNLPPVSMLLIVIGGIVYSVGVIFHVWEKLRFQNAIWHGFVVTAAAIHFAAVVVAV
ncbi:hemolysin III family protein [Paracoccus sediminis]|uniref:Hemolysin III n=1 Tax=Paracoccus sediminis TaxID=1214787 RepID=A0A238XBE4_9RHOB|nr:hemolysin III family protein [Paracoccus sediminis]TBN49613.1 hemolysin III family protein [Paracoccus sediminis]SNR56277.1 hemolysin III [Paracoccus sediminis]